MTLVTPSFARVAAATVAFAAAHPACAQDVDLDDIVASFARCVVAQDPDAARALVIADDRISERDSMQQMAEGRCGSVIRQHQATFIPELGIGAIASELVRRDTSRNLPVRRDDITMGAINLDAVARNLPTEKYARERALNGYVADCIVRSAPDTSRKWVAAAGSRQTQDAPVALRPVIDDCTRRFRRKGISPWSVAISYYRLANITPRQPSGAQN